MNYSICRKLALLMIVSGAFMTDLQAQTLLGIKAGANFATLGGSDTYGLKNRISGFLGSFFGKSPSFGTCQPATGSSLFRRGGECH